ncbi:MAG: T9SS type A sorting domain-containing protein, partial [Chlorobi bacterium]|nr:T9SS type A sorting domain-containing protein [Chlorobiota bacterium]
TDLFSSFGSIFKLNTETVGQPTIEHFCYLGHTPNQFIIQDDVLYTYSINTGAEIGKGFHVFNLDNPQKPELIFSLPETKDKSFRGMLIKDETLYLIKYDSLLVFDLSVPGYPVRTAGIQYPSWIWEMYLLGDYLYLHCDAKLYILDLNNPESWTDNPINPYADYGHAVYAGQDFCYFSAYGERNVHILDLHDPADPEQIGLYNNEEDINFITIDGDFIYGIQDDSLLVVFDISHRLYPTIISKYYCETSTKIQSVHVSDDYIIVSGFGEFTYAYILGKDRVTNISNNPDQISPLPLTIIYPNPVRRGANITIQSDITQGDIISLKIIDVRGTCVATVNTDNISFKTGSLTIPGIDLPTGNYYLIIETSKEQTVSKLIVH